ncbi:MAG: PAS domain S-box protein [Desulfatibacillum sp.]|nr:PAS domain S-box protein [Desulfatibacillum sp.]
MNERKRFILLIIIMTGICLSITAISLGILYKTALKVERGRLTETAQSQARLIEAIARFNYSNRTDYPNGPVHATLNQIKDAHENYMGFGKTGEFTLARREGNVIVFLLSHRHYDLNNLQPVSFDSTLAVPMKLALSGRSGTVIGLDYRGKEVLAAYEPVDVLNLGIVAKIDMSEIRAPYIRSAILIFGLMIVFVMLGAAFFIRISRPIIRRLEEQNRDLNREIDERNRSEEALKQSEGFLKSLLDTIPLPVFYKDKNGEYLGFNRAFEKFFGKTMDQLVGKTVFEIYSPELAELFHIKDGALFQSGGTQHYECQVENANGMLRDVIISKAALTDEQGDVTGLIGTFFDETEKKQAEIDLISREQLLNEMGNIARIGGWEHDILTGEATWTPEIFKIMEIDESGPIPGPNEHLSYYPPMERARLENAYNNAMETGKQFDLELQCTTAKGRLFWARAMGRPEFKDGQCIKLKGTFQDITERKKAEEQLQKAQKMESIGHLAGGIAHDFNNLLFPIIGMAELLMEDLPQGSLEHENAQVIFESGKRGGDLVKQILAFSRQSEHKLLPISVQQILKEVLKLIRATIPSFIELEEDIQTDCGMLMGDPTQIHQVAMNIITNAFHAVESTGGKISVQLREIALGPGELAYGPLGEGRYALLTIADTGQGMSPELMKKIFEPYFTTKEQGKGTGLGLAVAYGIIKEHQGDIKVYSEPGKGTSFNIFLPLLDKPGESETIVVAPEQQTGDERILLIDDEESIALLEKQMLERLGYTVTACFHSPEAVELFKANPKAFDLVISDMTMPHMTGDQVTEALLSIRPDIPVIICTGFSEKMDGEKAEAKGIKAFLMKPVIKAELAGAIRKALDEAK